jgi:hypothetical protein
MCAKAISNMRGGYMAKLSKKKQDELIQKEINRLNDVFKDLSDDKKEAAKELIERVAFMTVTLEILEDDIKTKGPTYMFENGKQKMLVENPAQKSYNTMINRYTSTYKELLNLLPKEVVEVTEEETDAFLAFNRKWNGNR